jgi:hypothetical protein
MKMTEHDLRQIIREEFMRGVPEFVFRQAAEECTSRLRQHVEKFVQMRAQNPKHMREMMEKVNVSLESLREEMYQLIEDKLFSIVQQS